MTPGDAGRAFAGVAGAVAGGLIGHFAVGWMAGQGLYAMILPGALLGIGCGALSASRSNVRGIVCAVAALALGVVTEWRHFPFLADESFGYFLGHLNALKPAAMLMIGLGTLAAYWFGRDGYRGALPGSARRRGDGGA